MILTKTQTAILKIFCSKITESFTIREISDKIGQNYSIVYSALQDLYKTKYLVKDKHKNFSLTTFLAVFRGLVFFFLPDTLLETYRLLKTTLRLFC